MAAAQKLEERLAMLEQLLHEKMGDDDGRKSSNSIRSQIQQAKTFHQSPSQSSLPPLAQQPQSTMSPLASPASRKTPRTMDRQGSDSPDGSPSTLKRPAAINSSPGSAAALRMIEQFSSGQVSKQGTTQWMSRSLAALEHYYKQHMAKQEKDLVKYADRCAQLEKDNAAMAAELKDQEEERLKQKETKRRLAEAETERDSLREENDTLLRENRRLQEDLSQCQQELEDTKIALAEETARADKEEAEKEAQRVAYERKLEDRDRKIKKLEEKVEHLTLVVDQLKGEIATMKINFKNQIAAMEAEFKKKMDALYREMEEQAEKFRAELDAQKQFYEDMMQSIQAELEASRARVEELVQEVEDKNEEIEDLKRELEKRDKQIEKLQQQVENLKAQVQKLKEELKRLNNEIVKLKREKKQLEDALQAMTIRAKKLKKELVAAEQKLEQFKATTGRMAGALLRCGNSVMKIGGGWVYVSTFVSAVCGVSPTGPGAKLMGQLIPPKSKADEARDGAGIRRLRDTRRGLPTRFNEAYADYMPRNDSMVGMDQKSGQFFMPKQNTGWSKTPRFSEVT